MTITIMHSTSIILSVFLCQWPVVITTAYRGTMSFSIMRGFNQHHPAVRVPKRCVPTRTRTRTSGNLFLYGSFLKRRVTRKYCTQLDDATSVGDEELLQEDMTVLNEEDLLTLTPGSSDGFYVVQQYKTSLDANTFDLKSATSSSMLTLKDVERLALTPHNMSLPVALMMLDPEEYPSQSKARKSCRKANVLIHRGPLLRDPETGQEEVWFNPNNCIRGHVGDRIYPGDVIAKQVRMGNGYFPVMGHKKPPFDLPVLYEDDYFAVVNKPAGVVVYANRKGGHGIMTVRSALPFVVTPPKIGTFSTLRRPQPVHRLDKPTSGILLVAKTKPAMVHLSMQFRDRKIKKTYIAIVNGIPPEPVETSILSQRAQELGVDVDVNVSAITSQSEYNPAIENEVQWQVIDHALDGKSAVTIWRSLRYVKSLKANDNYVTFVELKPKTGRYHQLRRHMAWVCERPIIGDNEYDGGGPTAMCFRDRGLFLCSNRVSLEHPFYNTPGGRRIFDKLTEEEQLFENGRLWRRLADDTVMVTVSIGTPSKFDSFMDREEERYIKLSNEGTELYTQ